MVIMEVPELSYKRRQTGSLGHKGQKCKPGVYVCESLKTQVLAGGIWKGREHQQQAKTPLANTLKMPRSGRRFRYLVLIHIFSTHKRQHPSCIYAVARYSP